MDAAPLPGVIQETRGFNVIFIHSALDDAALSPAEFRVYAHLARRASSGAAWPSVRSIAAVCQLNKDTVCSALNLLEARQMVRRERRGFASTIYFLTPAAAWLSETEGQRILSENKGQGVRNEGTEPVRKEGTEGNPVEGNPQNSIPPLSPELENAGAATGGREDWKGRRLPRSNEAKRLSAMFERSPSRSWTEGEIVAFRALCPFDQDELRKVERFYVANWSRPDNPARCRRELLNLLLNWPGEVDKAVAWTKSHPEKRKAAAPADMPPEPPGFRSWFAGEYRMADPHHAWHDIPAEVKERYAKLIAAGEGQATFRDQVP